MSIERKNIMTALIGKRIGGITIDQNNNYEFWHTDPRDGVMFTVDADNIFDDEGNRFDGDEVKFQNSEH